MVIVKLIYFNSTNGTERLLFKVLVTDRTTVHVVYSTWQDGLHVALKLWACAVLYVTFSVLQEIRTIQSKIYMCSCKKTRLRKEYVMSHNTALNGVALLFRTC